MSFGIALIGTVSIGMNKHQKLQKLLNITAVTSACLIYILQFISGVFLVCSIYKMKATTRNQRDLQVNTFAMTLHAAAFQLYMASFFPLIYCVFAGSGLISLGIVQICSSLSQVILCIFFWGLGEKTETNEVRAVAIAYEQPQ